jgi:hypothetical protein
MSRFSLDALTKDIRERHVGTESKRLCEKWSRTGLLRGLQNYDRENMARLLENQAAELLRETSSLSTGAGALTSSGNVRGFTNVAFPIVRRVFGGLVANDLVSIQPMSLPAGLLFYLDYTYGNNVGGEASATASVYTAGDSIYNNPTGAGVRSGSLASGGQYGLVGTDYTKVHTSSLTLGTGSSTTPNQGAFTGASEAFASGSIVDTASDFTGTNARLAMFDPDVQADIDDNRLDVQYLFISTADLATALPNGDLQRVNQIAITDLGASPGGSVAWGESYQGGRGILNLRGMNERGDWDGATFTPSPLNGDHVKFMLRLTNGGAAPSLTATDIHVSMAVSDTQDIGGTDGDTLVIPSFESNFAVESSPTIPEIDIKIEQISVVATTRKLRARWSPELAQDLNAFHSLDAEVELTKILSEQVAVDIDREILNDLLLEANGANLFWSRAPGKFVNKVTGRLVQLTSTLDPGPEFTGTVREWYETLAETIIDAANTIHRKTLRGSANFVVTSPDVCTILEQSSLYRANYKLDGNGQVTTPFSIGAENVGSLSQRFQVYKDPYFPRNKILLGYKGGTYLETGYVYAPYVPLIVTPTIFGQEDFTPRKGVMTRYGKKMVRSDFYGTVTILDMNII